MGKRKLVGTALVSGIMLLSTLTGCGKDTATQPAASTKPVESQAAAAPTPKPASPVKLKLAMWDAKGDLTFWQEKVKEYTKLKPNVTVEVEKVPDNGGQYLKVRLAANDLPDLFYLKPAHMQIYKQSLLTLDELNGAKNNKFPAKIGGKILGAPLVSFSEFVYFHPSVFKEMNLEVPKTLPEFMSTMEKMKTNGKYTPIAIGGKEDWTFYPFMEFGPHILSGDENYLGTLAKTPEPFGDGSTFDKVGKVIKEMSSKKLAGPDALSISFDQSTQLFESKKAAMIAAGQWYYGDYVNRVKTDEDLGVFPLPFRASESEALTAMTLSDMNIGINKNSKNVEEAKAFFEWMFSKDVYQGYINSAQQFSTINGVNSEIPFFNKWTEKYPFKPFIYSATDEAFAKVSGAAQFDFKKAAQEIYSGKPIETLEKELNNKWKKAVESNK